MQYPNPYRYESDETNFYNDSLHGNGSAIPTLGMNPQSDIFLTRQKISNSIKALRKNARKQLEQADELETLLEQFLSMSRHINQNHIHARTYLHDERPLSQPAAPTDCHDDLSFMNGQENILPNSFHPQHAATASFPNNNNESFSFSPQNFDFNSDNTTYNGHGF